jgi:transposase
MQKTEKWTFEPEVRVDGMDFVKGCGLATAFGTGTRSCPDCGVASTSQHSWHFRQLQDLPAQGVSVTIKLQVGRWRCRNEQCSRRTFVERLSATAVAFARRTCHVTELMRLFGHVARGRASQKLLARLAMPASDSTILRQLKRHVGASGVVSPMRIAGIDDWSWGKGFTKAHPAPSQRRRGARGQRQVAALMWTGSTTTLSGRHDGTCPQTCRDRPMA